MELPVISIENLQNIFDATEHFPNPTFLQTIVTLAFFSLFRASNLFPKDKFDPVRDLKRRDCTIHEDKIVFNIPWTKTRQTRQLTKITIVATIWTVIMLWKMVSIFIM